MLSDDHLMALMRAKHADAFSVLGLHSYDNTAGASLVARRQIHTLGRADLPFDELGSHNLRFRATEAMDPVADYLEVMRSLFDFEAMREANPRRHDVPVQEALAPLVALPGQVARVRHWTGMAEPGVATRPVI